jgi:N-glycosylase/DNA lyase
MQLINQINELKNSDVKNIVNLKIKEFNSFSKKPEEDWFSELCFCILTANSKAETALKIQENLGFKGFAFLNQRYIAETIKKNKHRFHNNKAKFIVEARKFKDIKKIVLGMSEIEARDFIVKNVKGIGYKEASHFLRNTGSKSLAILDRHILNLMSENKLIEKPKTLNKNNYVFIEKEFGKLAEKTNLSPAELDLYMWYLKTGKILK